MLSKLMQDNYKEIQKAAVLITRRMGTSPHELINESYLTLSTKDYPKDNEGFVKYVTQIMKYQSMSPRSSFNKANRIGIEVKFEPINEEYKDIELIIDDVSEYTKETIEGLSHLTKEKINKYIQALEFKESLAPHEKTLFELHFEDGLSSRKIAEWMSKEFGIFEGGSYVRYNEMINQIKTKLKTWM